MTSPLNWIRKRQRLLMGVFGVLLIFTFTVSMGTGYDPLIEFLSGRGWRSSRTVPVVFQSDWGNLDEMDLERLRINRYMIARFLGAVSYQASQRGAQPSESRCNDQVDEENLVELFVLAKQAQTAGLSITNEEIKNYLAGLTDNRVEEWEYAAIWKQVTNGKSSERQLFELLRTELLAHRFRELSSRGNAAGSPVQVWELFNRLERRLTVEMFAVPVDEFMSQVEPPSERELRTFFDAHKDNFENPNLGIPGFKSREKRAFRFVKFDFETLLETEAEKVTEDQVREYYDKNKELFIKTDLQMSDLKPDDGSQEPSEPAADGPSTDAAEETSPAPTPTPIPQDAPQEPSADEPPPTTDASPTSEALSTATPGAASGPAAVDESKYQPLDEVRDEIKRMVAIPLVQVKLDALMAKVGQAFSSYQQAMIQWEARRQRDPKLLAPELPDLGPFAAELPLSVESIPLTDIVGIREYPIGRSYDMLIEDRGSELVEFPNAAFQSDQALFEVTKFPTAPDQWPKYLYWVTERQESKVMTFAEAREVVELAFKRQRAFQLALTAAQQEAEKARQASKPLEEACVKSGRVFIPSTDVRWMTSLSLPTSGGMMPALGRIEGVEGVSDDMMREIFRLNPGEVGVAVNGPKSAVYVVRVISEAPSPEVRRERFMREGAGSQEMQYLAASEMFGNRRDWYTHLRESHHAKFLREPRVNTRSR